MRKKQNEKYSTITWEELKKARQDSLDTSTGEISILQAEADELR